MYPRDLDQTKLSSFSSPAPFTFGRHPNFERSKKEHLKRLGQGDFGHGEVPLSALSDPRHPEVFVIPRDRLLDVVDDYGDAIGMERTMFPFSSADFYVDIDEKGLFYDFGHSEAFLRLMKINQLSYLVPPRPEKWNKKIRITYTIPQFPHTRWIHCLLTAVLTDLILARNGFSKKERAPLVLTAGAHDIATPAGGDSVKRIDPGNLNEEKNFTWALEYYGLTKRWTKQFGFNVSEAQKWVKGEGMFGELLDAIDKICYTALDCYYLGLAQPGKVRDFCLQHPLVMDVWQDIRFTPDHTDFAFLQAERLFWFLLLRAYEFQELLFNPYARDLDLFFKELIQYFYKRGKGWGISKEQLLTHDDEWLEEIIREGHPVFRSYDRPRNLSWRKFRTAKEQREFCAKLKNTSAVHLEHIAKFTSGLDWPVWEQGKMIPLRQIIDRDKIDLLEEVISSTQGYYVYYRP